MSAFSKYVLLASVTHVGENTAGIIRGNNNHATRGDPPDISWGIYWLNQLRTKCAIN